MKYAIALAGNIVADTTKYIPAYPAKLELTPILGMTRSLGGAVPNVGLDLAALDGSLPLAAIGFVGEDENGDYAIRTLSRAKSLDLKYIGRQGVTSFTDVMTVKDTGERTFFTYKGADSLITPETLPPVEADILHVGYALLLDGLDEEDAQYGTKMARALHDAKSRGVMTSLDVVSENSDRYRRIVPPALKYTDYFSVNELEAARVTGVNLVRDGAVDPAAAEEALLTLRRMGVSRWAVIHTPEIAIGLDEKDRLCAVKTLSLPKGFIKGSVGAGDAFTAGLLMSAHRGADLDQALNVANAVAAISLSQPGATEGVKSLDETMAFARSLSR